MKRFNWNALVLVFALALLMTGWSEALGDALRYDQLSPFETYRDRVDKAAAEKLANNDQLMDLYAVEQRAMGVRVVVKDDTTVVRADSGSLIVPSPAIPDEELREIAGRVSGFQQAVEDRGAVFLYAAAPTKNNGETVPKNVVDASKSNFERFLKLLGEKNVPVLDLTSIHPQYFRTDHHWLPASGFDAARAICERLSESNAFDYDASLLDRSKWNAFDYPEFFLGSYGKKYCDKHAPLHVVCRPSAGKRGYGSKWQKVRKKYLETHPLCVACVKEGRYVKATDVDHVIPHRGDQKLFWDQSNWQALCHSCHSKKTARENRERVYHF